LEVGTFRVLSHRRANLTHCAVNLSPSSYWKVKKLTMDPRAPT